MSRKRGRRFERSAAHSTLQRTLAQVRLLSRTDVATQVSTITRAQAEFARGQNCAAHWLSLADTANMAETFAAMGLGAGDDADEVISRAQQALHDVHQRHAHRGTWTLYADEIDALHWLVRLHQVQLSSCTFGEFERAMAATERRLDQARRGNAPAGALVVVGQISAQPGG